MSNHKPLFIDIDCCVSRLARGGRHKSETKKTFTVWHKVSADSQCIEYYHNELNNKLRQLRYRDVYDCQNPFCMDQDHCDQIDKWCDDLIEMCLSSEHVFPQAKRSTKTIAGWTDSVKPYKDECNFWYHMWKVSGKPGCPVTRARRVMSLPCRSRSSRASGSTPRCAAVISWCRG